jgi:hypothetical protein
MKTSPMKVIAHAQFQELLSLIEKIPGLAKRWRGIGFRSVIPAAVDPVKILSGRDGGQAAPITDGRLD